MGIYKGRKPFASFLYKLCECLLSGLDVIGDDGRFLHFHVVGFLFAFFNE